VSQALRRSAAFLIGLVLTAAPVATAAAQQPAGLAPDPSPSATRAPDPAPGASKATKVVVKPRAAAVAVTPARPASPARVRPAVAEVTTPARPGPSPRPRVAAHRRAGTAGAPATIAVAHRRVIAGAVTTTRRAIAALAAVRPVAARPAGGTDHTIFALAGAALLVLALADATLVSRAGRRARA
jgi:hypothetical protein